MYTDKYLEANPTLKAAKEMVDKVEGKLGSDGPWPNWDLVDFLAQFLDISKAHTLLWETECVDLIVQLVAAGEIGASYFSEVLISAWCHYQNLPLGGDEVAEEQPSLAHQTLLKLILNGEVSIVGVNCKFTVEHKTVVGMWNPGNLRQIYFYPTETLARVDQELEFRGGSEIKQQLVNSAVKANLDSVTKVVRIDGRPRRVMVLDAVALGLMRDSDYDLA